MASQSRSGWKAATGSLVDTARTINVMPSTYFALFALNAVPTFARLGYDWSQDIENPDVSNAELTDLGLSLLCLVLMIPPCIALLRYFSAGHAAYPHGIVRLSVRFILWTLFFVLVAVLAIFSIAVPAVVIQVNYETTGEEPSGLAIAALAILSLVLITIFSWLSLRLTTFYPNLALEEHTPLRTGFRETRGWFWFLFRAAFFFFIISSIITWASLYMWVLVMGGSAMEWHQMWQALIEMTSAKQELMPRTILAILSGVFGALFVSWQMAFLGRVSRTVRDVEFWP